MPKAFYSVENFRRGARRRMPRMIFDALDGAAGTERASRLNMSTLENIRLQSRILVNVEHRELSTTFLDRQWDVPFGIAPMGMCNLFWPGADVALASVSQEKNMPLAVSTMASSSLESISERTGGNAWFQLYAGESQELTKRLVDRASEAGYRTLILTADVPVLAPRLRDLANGFQVPFTMGLRQVADFARHPRWVLNTLLNGTPNPVNVASSGSGERSSVGSTGFRREAGRGHIDWGFLSQLRSMWAYKLVVKGVMSPTDAKMAVDAGVDAVYVSNHGGRQLDAAPGAIQMLPLIRQAVGPDYPLLFDSGIRSGEGIAKALVSGANFVMLGRPFLYALGAGGPNGLRHLLDMLANELSIVMAQLGCNDVRQLNRSMLVTDL